MSSWWLEPARVLWLSAPVVVAALVHVAVMRLRLLTRLAAPLDGGRTLRGRRLFGDNKTWRGALVMIGVSTAAAPLQGLLRLPSLEYFDYGQASLPLVGALLGLGFILGELPNSFLKRQLDVAPGARGGPFFVLLDQVDSLVGCLALLAFVWVAPLSVWVWVLVLCSGLHMLVNWIMVLVGVKQRVF